MRLINSVAANSGGSLYSCGGYRQTFYQLNTHSITLLCFHLILPMQWTISVSLPNRRCALICILYYFALFWRMCSIHKLILKSYEAEGSTSFFLVFFSWRKKAILFKYCECDSALRRGELVDLERWNILGFTGDDLCKQGHSAPFIVVWIRQFIIAMPAGCGATW